MRATLARLVELFDHDAGALARTALLLLTDLGTSLDVAVVPGLPRGAVLTRHLSQLCAIGSVDVLVVTPDTPGFGERVRSGPKGPGVRLDPRSDPRLDSRFRSRSDPRSDLDAFPLHATRLASARQFASRAVLRERRVSGSSERLERLEAIARALDPWR